MTAIDFHPLDDKMFLRWAVGWCVLGSRLRGYSACWILDDKMVLRWAGRAGRGQQALWFLVGPWTTRCS